LKTLVAVSEESMYVFLKHINHDYCYYLESDLIYIMNLSGYKYPQEEFNEVLQDYIFLDHAGVLYMRSGLR
jgi:hypothetical protein